MDAIGNVGNSPLPFSQEGEHDPTQQESCNPPINVESMPTPQGVETGETLETTAQTDAQTDAQMDAQTEAETNVVKKDRRKSIVWKHFELMMVNGQQKAQCNYCKKLLGGDSKNGTKHLLSHMETCVPKKLKERGSNNKGKMLRLNWGKKRAKTSFVKTELDRYLEEDVIPRNGSDFDILMWWKLNGVKYPTLQAIAKDVLAIPVSTVASESSFSTSGIILSPHRSRLHWTTLEALMCARSWLWSAEKTSGSNSKLCNAYATLLDEMESDDEGELASSITTYFEE